jgi:ubiquinone/menaquinone biosynthesis C-methylase UbiE
MEGKPHQLWPDLSLDDRSRLDFMKSYRRFVTGELQPINRDVYERRVEPAFARANGAPPASKQQVRKAMVEDPFFAFYASARRSGQELMWQYCLAPAERELPELKEACEQLPEVGGSLTVDPAFEPPLYVASIDIHCMPGGYLLERGPGDVTAGAIYDLGNDVYTMGHLGPLQDMFGRTTSGYVRRTWPERSFERILDMGCTIGLSTLPYKSAYPEAEVHGIDVGAPVLRYADARARSLGVAAHFSQQNAERTNFEDASFDLIVSHILLHETSGGAIRNIFRECHRLLKPGGIMLHVDMLSYGGMDSFDQFMFDNETFYNNEPFWASFRGLDQLELAKEAGFGAEDVRIEHFSNALAEQVQKTGSSTAAKAPPKSGFQMLIGTRR